MWPFSKQPQRVIVFDSTEKCGGTSTKAFLRELFPQEQFFDLDNGDPPTETVRNYGIQCPISFSAENLQGLDFYPPFIDYLSDRAEWLLRSQHLRETRCIYGNMIAFTHLLPKLKERGVRVLQCKIFRDPIARIVSEFNYVKGHAGHNLHWLAIESSSLEEYVSHPHRPRNRQTASVLGDLQGNAFSSALERIESGYYFIGFIDQLNAGLNYFSLQQGLKSPPRQHRNASLVRSAPTVSQEARDLILVSDSQDIELYKNLRSKYWPFAVLA